MRWRAASRLDGRCGGSAVAMDDVPGIKGGTELFFPKGEYLRVFIRSCDCVNSTVRCKTMGRF